VPWNFWTDRATVPIQTVLLIGNHHNESRELLSKRFVRSVRDRCLYYSGCRVSRLLLRMSYLDWRTLHGEHS
jgi:hypothetical protein